LLFMGRTDGRIMALDKRNGSTLWSWQLDAPISAPVTTFEHKGEQLVAVYAAGNYFTGSRRGDGVWLLSRKGTMKPAAPLADAAPASQRVTAADAVGGVAEAGRVVFQRTCAPCHGENGKGGHSEGAILPDNISAASVMATATTGKKDMPAFRATLSTQELRDVAAYAERLLAK
jgi:quinohemoprotein ethanol dehydrogenase